MILAYKLGLKTQTRRTRGLDEINQAPDEWQFERFVESGKRKRVFVMEREAARFVNKAKTRFIDVRLPYGSVGHALWFRETWKMWECDKDGRDFLHYRADDEKIDPTWWSEKEWTRPDPVWCKKDVFEKWQPSMFMPKLCCRFRDVKITDVRAERLQDISVFDAEDEGINQIDFNCFQNYMVEKDWVYKGRNYKGFHFFEDPIASYMSLWDKINGKTLPADLNPWVFIYKYPKFKQSEAK